MGKKLSSTQPTDERLYNRIAALRADLGESRAELATALGVNYQTVGYLERSEYHPSLALAFRIAEHFDVPIDAVFSRTPFAPMSQSLYARTDDRL